MSIQIASNRLRCHNCVAENPLDYAYLDMKYCAQCPSGYPDSLFTCPMHGGVLHEIRELKPGMVIHKAYRIVRKLGQGGMGTVYLADHILMQEPRALKFLSWELCQDEAFTTRFRQEVRTLQRIHHKNVVDCGDLEPAEDNSLFFPMEFVDGPDLWDFLRASPILLDMELALSLSIAITEGLSAAHALGLVHRDIKPENILLAQSGEEWVPKIADFGIVAIKESGNTRTRTKTGASLLTMEYAAPEQWRGMRAGALDGRTDIYALGGVVYEMLTGKAAFEAESYEGWAECHKNDTPKRPSELRPELAEWPGLDELVLQMLAKDREQRPANTAEVLRRLKEIQQRGASGSVAGLTGAGIADSPLEQLSDRSGTRPLNRKETLYEVSQVPFDVPPPLPAKTSTGPHDFHEPLPPPPRSFGKGSEPGLAGSGTPSFGAAFEPFHVSTQNSGPASYATGNAVPPKPGKWIPLALAALVLFAAGGLIYYFHASKKPVEQATQYVPPPAQTEDKPVAPPSSKPEVIPEPKPVEIPNAQPVSPKPVAPDISSESVTDTVNRAQALDRAKRYSEAAPLFERGCTGGSALACNQLGFLYEEGLGVPKTPAKSIPLYTKGCDLDSEVACFNLAVMYNQGIGTKQDYGKAATLYSKSCDAADAAACNSLGVMYHSGHGVSQDYARSAALYVKACSGGEAAACSNLGDCYLTGDGVPKDLDKAKEYLNKGCTMGDKWGCDRLKAAQ